MILNSRNNNFIITIPRNFVYPSIVKKYETYLKRLPLPYDNLSDYLNASIQAMTFPSLSTELVEQVLYEEPVSAGFEAGSSTTTPSGAVTPINETTLSVEEPKTRKYVTTGIIIAVFLFIVYWFAERGPNKGIIRKRKRK